MRLACGEGAIDAPDALVSLSSERTRPDRFVTAEAREVLLELCRSSGVPAQAVGLGSPHVPDARVRLDGRTLHVYYPEDVFSAEAVLRTAWQVVVNRAGGVLVHGSAFHWNGVGVAAIGESTAGKSTLARLCCAHPGYATLLTDEIVHLLADGTIYGTPFRSDADNAGAPGPARARSLLLLKKGDHERLDEVSAEEALPVLLGQMFIPVIRVVPQGELSGRLMSAVNAVGVHRLTFRKDSAVGPFLREWVAR